MEHPYNKGNHEPSSRNREGAETIEKYSNVNLVEYIQVDGSARLL